MATEVQPPPNNMRVADLRRMIEQRNLQNDSGSHQSSPASSAPSSPNLSRPKINSDGATQNAASAPPLPIRNASLTTTSSSSSSPLPPSSSKVHPQLAAMQMTENDSSSAPAAAAATSPESPLRPPAPSRLSKPPLPPKPKQPSPNAQEHKKPPPKPLPLLPPPKVEVQPATPTAATVEEVEQSTPSASTTTTAVDSPSVRSVARHFDALLSTGAMTLAPSSSSSPPSSSSTSSFSLKPAIDGGGHEVETEPAAVVPLEDAEPDEIVVATPEMTPSTSTAAAFVRQSASSIRRDSAVHAAVLAELVRKGHVRESLRAMSTVSPSSPGPSTTATEASGSVQQLHLPDGVGKLRDPTKKKSPIPIRDSGVSTRTGGSGSSERSSTLSTSDLFTALPNTYETGNEEEDKRLRSLHHAAIEFLTVQQRFVDYMHEMNVTFPAYLEQWADQKGAKSMLRSREDGQPHPIIQLKKHIAQIFPVHEALLTEFRAKIVVFTSLQPDLMSVLQRHAPFLKVCRNFLVEKARLASDLCRALKEDRELEQATLMYERHVFKRGVGGVVQQLDQVHQNFLRYKILTKSYSDYLLKDSEEARRATEVLGLLEKIAQQVNDALGLPTYDETLLIYERFQCRVDVFSSGRCFRKVGELLKQSRKEVQPRWLVLFSDSLWICRAAAGTVSSGEPIFNMDMGRFYNIPIGQLSISTVEDDELERDFQIQSKQKSALFRASSKRERDTWLEAIRTAAAAYLAARQRRSGGARRREGDGHRDEHDPERTATTGSHHHHHHHHQHQHPREEATAPPAVLPVWIADQRSSKCMMRGCTTEFSWRQRRHHCRSCGWLVCAKCTGRAPIPLYDFERQRVCAECFDVLRDKLERDDLFPANRTHTSSTGQRLVSISGRWLEPTRLFTAPQNAHFRRRTDLMGDVLRQNGGGGGGDNNNVAKTSAASEYIAATGEVELKTGRNKWAHRHARLLDGARIMFFKAALDADPSESNIVFGYAVDESVDDATGKVVFTLTHSNQIRVPGSGQQLHELAFRVDSSTADKWTRALKLISLEPDDDDDNNDNYNYGDEDDEDDGFESVDINS